MTLANTVGKDEKLYRAVKRSKPSWIDGDNVSSAMFKDERGVSVDRDGNRSENDIIVFMQNGNLKGRVKAIIKVLAKDCYDIHTRLTANPSDDNPYHANIWLDEDNVNIQNLQAKRLADCSERVFYNDNMNWIY